MADLFVPVTRIEKLLPHPNADRLEIARLEGLDWQVVVGKGTYQPGDMVIYVPPDAMVPEMVSDALDVTRYLSKGRVRSVKLRGEPSHGFAFPVNALDMEGDWKPGTTPALGENVAEAFGITKYEPPHGLGAGDEERPHPLFPAYTDIRNIRDHPDMFDYADEVFVTEKIHGTNSRVGLIDGEYMAGSSSTRRKMPENLKDNLYWYPITLPSVITLLETMRADFNAKQVILYGEIYGRVQPLKYGVPDGLAYRAFDLLVDGHYVNGADFHLIMDDFRVPTVPVMVVDRYGRLNLPRLSNGPSLVPGAMNIREGVVVKPVNGGTWLERDPETNQDYVRRKIGKYVGDDFLCGLIEDQTHG